MYCCVVRLLTDLLTDQWPEIVSRGMWAGGVVLIAREKDDAIGSLFTAFDHMIWRGPLCEL